MTTDGDGGPLNATQPMVLYIYRTAFKTFHMGYAAAQTVVLFLVLLTSRCCSSGSCGRDALTPPLTAPTPRRGSARPAGRRGRIVAWTLLLLGGIVMVMPLLFMLSTSLKTAGPDLRSAPDPARADARELPLALPGRPFLLLVLQLARRSPPSSTLSVLFFDSLVGYTLCKFRFRGRGLVFIAILSTLMIPTEMLVIPWYLMARHVRLAEHLLGHHVPGPDDRLRRLPDEAVLRDRAGRLHRRGADRRAERVRDLVEGRDAAGAPALSALAIFTFLGNWTAFLWPLIATSDRKLYTLPVGLASFAGEFRPMGADHDRRQRRDPSDAARLHPVPALHHPRRHARGAEGLSHGRRQAHHASPVTTTRLSRPVYRDTVLAPLFEGVEAPPRRRRCPHQPARICVMLAEAGHPDRGAGCRDRRAPCARRRATIDLELCAIPASTRTSSSRSRPSCGSGSARTCGAAAHRALAQRHGPHAVQAGAEGSRSTGSRRGARPRRRAPRRGASARTRHADRRLHPRPAGAADHLRPLSWRAIEVLLRDWSGSSGARDRRSLADGGRGHHDNGLSRSTAQRVAELLGFAAPQENSYGCIASCDYVTATYAAAEGDVPASRPVRPGPAAVDGFEVGQLHVPERLRADQLDHAAEAQPGADRAPAAAGLATVGRARRDDRTRCTTRPSPT